MLIAWSPKSPRSYYGLLLLQMISIIIGVLISIRRNQLSIDDAEFAVILTRSPLCAYCMFLVLPRLFMKTVAHRAKSAVHNLKLLPTAPTVAWNGLMTDLGSQAIFDGLCGVLTLLSCLVLDVSVQLNPITKSYSPIPCGTGDCWQSQTSPDIGTVHRWVALIGTSLIIYECVLVRHKKLRWELMGKFAGESPRVCLNNKGTHVDIQHVIHQPRNRFIGRGGCKSIF